MQKIAESELILNPDGSIYHLKLLPEQLAGKVILVGDPGRVAEVSAKFDEVEHRVENREFVTHTGRIGQTRISAVSTGIGTDNVDIVLNELDALVNIDLKARTILPQKKSLDLIRIGTSGSLQEDIGVDSFVLSSFGLGFDGLLNFYDHSHNTTEEELRKAFIAQTGWKEPLTPVYFAQGSEMLRKKLEAGMHTGITATAGGFYGPQGRKLRLTPRVPDLNEKLTAFSHHGQRVTNFEMETSALYGLSSMMGHNACTVCAIIANRIRKEYSKDYKKTVKLLIETVLERISQ